MCGESCGPIGDGIRLSQIGSLTVKSLNQNMVFFELTQQILTVLQVWRKIEVFAWFIFINWYTDGKGDIETNN